RKAASDDLVDTNSTHGAPCVDRSLEGVSRLALFGFRKKDAGGEGDADGGQPEGGFKADPAKARTWFEHGRKTAATSNFEYALTCYASAVKLDPSNLEIHEAMLDVARKFLAAGGKPASGKDLKGLEAAAKAGQDAYGGWLAPKLLNMLRAQKKPSKSMWVQAKDRFSAVSAWNEAFMAGEEAVRLDPSDTELIAELKQLTAQRAITQGGYAEAAAQGEGGFRAMVKDLDKQRELEASESISGGADTQTIAIDKARKEHRDNPLSPEAVSKLGQLLRRLGTPDAEEEARMVYLDGFNRIGEYRFKASAADIELARLRRTLRSAEEALAAAPSDAAKKADVAAARSAVLQREQEEFTERVAKYPTDRRLKLDLGRVLIELDRHEDAMACFQECKDEPKFRVEAAHRLGNCFARSGWHPEAISEYREALEHLDATERDRELPLRYDLMLSLIALARDEKSVQHAREAAEICSQILRKDISFRDIRDRRKEIDTITKELTGG
ncbi:MAG: hypothetical protein ACO38P_08230, partial [Phycisphaerales bacterium]